MLAASILLIALLTTTANAKCPESCDEKKGPIWTTADGKTCKIFRDDCVYRSYACDPFAQEKSLILFHFSYCNSK